MSCLRCWPWMLAALSVGCCIGLVLAGMFFAGSGGAGAHDA